MYTKGDRLKSSCYAQAISAVLADLKQVKNQNKKNEKSNL